MFLRSLRRQMGAAMQRHLSVFLRVYPPYVGAGVRVVEMSDDYRTITVEMPLKWFNKNYVGTHFGGSLYSMCDPFFMLILVKNLGSDYIVWDKAATIRFRKPGRGTMRAHFHLTSAQIEEIRQTADSRSRVEPEFCVDVIDSEGEVVAEVKKTLYIRRKSADNAG
jgi:acyl-coenzyme A thioesterase PaaI-like protein